MEQESPLINFDSFFSKVQPCVDIDKFVIEKYFLFVYKDLKSRLKEKEVKRKKVGKLIFASYLNLPFVVSDRIFKTFNTSDSGFLNRTEFITGMLSLYYSGSLDSLVKITFNIFDYDDDGRIFHSDVRNFFDFLDFKSNGATVTGNYLAAMVKDLFTSDYLNFEEYAKKIENTNSNIFWLLLMILYDRQPFNLAGIHFFRKSLQIKLPLPSPVDNKDIDSKEKQIIFPSDPIFNRYKLKTSQFLSRKLRRKNETTNIFSYLEKENKLNIPDPLVIKIENPEMRNNKLYFNFQNNITTPKADKNDFVINSNIIKINTVSNSCKSIKQDIRTSSFKNCLPKLEVTGPQEQSTNCNNESNSQNICQLPINNIHLPTIDKKKLSVGMVENLKLCVNFKFKKSNTSAKLSTKSSNNSKSVTEDAFYTSSSNSNVDSPVNRKEEFQIKINNSVNNSFEENYSSNTGTFFGNDVTSQSEEYVVYKVEQNSKLYKCKLILKENHIFCFRYSKMKQVYELESLHPLHGYYVCKCEEIDFKGTKFYPFGLLLQWGNTFANMRNYFLFLQNESRDQFVEKLNSDMGHMMPNISKSYKLSHTIGKGQFSKVKLGENVKSHMKVAVKVIDKYELRSQEMELIRNEIDVMKFVSKSDHPNFIKLLEVLEDRNNIYIITELVKEGSLRSFMEKNTMNYTKIKSIARQVLEGLMYLHKFGIIHRDIKPENILLQSNSSLITVKIIDFGLAKVVGKNQKNLENYGTLLFTAPEMLLKTGYDEKVDVWSYGVLLYNIFYKTFPFNGSNKKDIINKICNQPVSFPHNPLITKEENNLIRNCLEINPQLRIDFNQIKYSKWW